MAVYDSEQGGDHNEGQRMDHDLYPWFDNKYDTEVHLTEFPYYTYLPDDHPDVVEGAERRDIEPEQLHSDYIRKNGPFRTDIVAVAIDYTGLTMRTGRLGHSICLNQPESGKRRYRRTYLNFVRDGPMTREYYEEEYGIDTYDEPRSYCESVSSAAFAWLKERGFLVPVGDNEWDAVELPLHITDAHAIELKIQPGQWETALEQASRASCYADYRWVGYDGDSLEQVDENVTERFKEEGIGLISIHPDSVELLVDAEPCTPEIDRKMLSRYMVERWDMNERVFSKLEDISVPERRNRVPTIHSGSTEVEETSHSKDRSEYRSLDQF